MLAKVCLVTGSGAPRVGAGVVEALAARGEKLVVHFHSSKTDAEARVGALRARGIDAVAIAADLTDESAVDRLIETTLSTFGRLDVLVHCASVWRPKRLEEVSAADVRMHLEANTLATFLCARRAGLAMVAQRTGGAIVTFGDWATCRPYVGYAAYFPSKGAIGALTRSLAVELAQRNPNVRVNCILPGPVLLPEDLPADEREEAIAGTLVQRVGTPEHIAQAVLFLIDNTFVTGAELVVDGGRSIK